jgi:hypothetical protein
MSIKIRLTRLLERHLVSLMTNEELIEAYRLVKRRAEDKTIASLGERSGVPGRAAPAERGFKLEPVAGCIG